MSKWQTWLCEKCGVSHAMNETKCFHCSHPKPTTPPGEQQGFPPRFFAASDNFDKEGKPYTEQIRVWPEYSGAYPEFYTEFMSKDTHTALLSEAVRVARSEAFELIEFIYRGQTCPMRMVETYDKCKAASTEGGKG